MSEPKFDFYFEQAGRSGTQGAIAPAEQFFEGSAAEVSLAREIGQNSLDARAGDGPVVIRFELAEMTTDELPGIETLRTHLNLVAEQTAGSEGNSRMVAARVASQRQTIPVLRISDFGTTGLGGSESKESSQSPLSALTRGAGISANDGARGGSFGIGSAVGPMSSDLCTVFYASLPLRGAEVVFAGYSRLASHRDGSGDWRQAEGFYTDISRGDDFSYLRNPAPIGPFDARSVVGTDIYILGYRKADDDPSLENIKNAFLSHFLVAIHRGRLEVEGVGGGKSWRLDSGNLREQVKGHSEAQAFYAAIQDQTPITTHSPRFGLMSLYIYVDESLNRSMHTITLRKPLMKIDTFKHTSIPAKYAAILECSDESGNQLLRALEPPQHDRWDPGRAVDGASALQELKFFVREGLKSRVKEQLGDIVEIKGLSKYLPTENLRIGKDDFGPIPSSEEGRSEESATVRGEPSEPMAAVISPRKAVKVAVRTSAAAEGDRAAEKGKDQGGSGRRESSTRGLPGAGDEGDGRARIARGDVRFRSWSDHGTGSLTIALTAFEDMVGDLELLPIGAGGAVEEDYLLPIVGAERLNSDGAVPIAWARNVLSDLSLSAGQTTLIRLRLEKKSRYRLDVK